MFNRRAVYGLITAFFVLCIVIFVTIGITYVARYTTLFKVRIADTHKQDLSAAYKKELLQYCLGRIIDPAGPLNVSCVEQGIGDVRGMTLSVVPSPGCVAHNITFREPQEYTGTEVLSVPVYQDGRMRICPGRLHIFT